MLRSESGIGHLIYELLEKKHETILWRTVTVDPVINQDKQSSNKHRANTNSKYHVVMYLCKMFIIMHTQFQCIR